MRLLWEKSWEIAWDQADLEMSNGIPVLRINSVSLWLADDHMWKPINPTKINIDGVENTFSQVLLSILIGVGCTSI
jgi:hypothetical protein